MVHEGADPLLAGTAIEFHLQVQAQSSPTASCIFRLVLAQYIRSIPPDARLPQVQRLAQLLEESPGTIPLVFHISGQTKRSSRGIANAPYVKTELERIVGPGNVRIGYPV